MTTMYKHQTINDGLKVWGRDAEVEGCYISHRKLADEPAYDIKKEAGVVLWGGNISVKNTVIHNSQRALCAFDYSWIPKGKSSLLKSSVLYENVHFHDSLNVLNKSNRSESFMVHRRTKRQPCGGFSEVTYNNCSTNNMDGSSFSIWNAEIDRLKITNCHGPHQIDISVMGPIRNLFIRDVDVTRVLIRMAPGFDIGMVGDWSLDNAYKYTLVDARTGTGSTIEDDIVGEFDSPQDIRDWWADSNEGQWR